METRQVVGGRPAGAQQPRESAAAGATQISSASPAAKLPPPAVSADAVDAPRTSEAPVASSSAQTAHAARQAQALGATLGTDTAQVSHTAALGRLFAADLPGRLKSWDSSDVSVRDLALTALSRHPSLTEATSRFYGRRVLLTGIHSVSVDGRGLGQLADVAPSPEADRGLASDIMGLVRQQLAQAQEQGTSVALDANLFAVLDPLFEVRPGISEGFSAEDVKLLQRMSDATLLSSRFDTEWNGDLETADAIAGVAGRLAGRSDGAWNGQRTLELLEREPVLASKAAKLALALGTPPSEKTVEHLIADTQRGLGRIDDRSLFYNEAWLGGRLKLLEKVSAALGEAAPERATVRQRLLSGIPDSAPQVQARVADLLSTTPAQPAIEVKRIDGRQYFVSDTPEKPPHAGYKPQGPTDRAEAVAALEESELPFISREDGDQALLAIGDRTYAAQVRPVAEKVLRRGFGMSTKRVFERLQHLAAYFPEESARALDVFTQLFRESVQTAKSAQGNVFAFEDSSLPDAVRGPLLQAATTTLQRVYEDLPEQRRDVDHSLAFGFRELAALTPGWADGLTAAELAPVLQALEAVGPPQPRDREDTEMISERWKEESAEALALIQGA